MTYNRKRHLKMYCNIKIIAWGLSRQVDFVLFSYNFYNVRVHLCRTLLWFCSYMYTLHNRTLLSHLRQFTTKNTDCPLTSLENVIKGSGRRVFVLRIKDLRPMLLTKDKGVSATVLPNKKKIETSKPLRTQFNNGGWIHKGLKCSQLSCRLGNFQFSTVLILINGLINFDRFSSTTLQRALLRSLHQDFQSKRR